MMNIKLLQVLPKFNLMTLFLKYQHLICVTLVIDRFVLLLPFFYVNFDLVYRNRLLATLFQTSDKKIISRALESARTVLMSRFVPYHLGFSHITRRQIIDQHTSTISRQLMCDDEFDKVIIVADGTYIYIQVNSHHVTFFRESAM